ncbi:hypothetical protein B0H16DRAFT_1727893 [Mycena metata]|uniref:Extracellular membrane protein CFEM domain-containing protein n=1 Tax=Mycena metata TaxID=1033252 RepID=A0AAD7IHN2_9AGAR|nr:hypothetical protein B0H16DRAFT_1727893 [Mycena metata]
MFSKLVSAALLTVLAGRALAFDSFNVTLGTTVFQATEVLAFTSTPVIVGCAPQCQLAQANITACATNDPTCLCAPATTGPLLTCEQCLFTALIAANQPAPDPRAGSNPAVTGWTLNCATLKQPLATPMALTLPDSWDGPFVSVFPTAIGWVIAVTGGVLGSSLIYMLCNM